MKKNGIAFIVLIWLLSIQSASAQWVTAGSDIYFGTGKVGVGIATPLTALHIRNPLSTLLTLQRSSSNMNVCVEYKNDTSSVFAGLDVNGGFTISKSNNLLPFSLFTAQINGNVGIGTTTPNAKLAVNGNIRAKEIKVETANWPDYVFAKDYPLPSLQQTEKHIKEKGHLPGIPSAEEVKANGVDLGVMNAKLLKKIEEITLYLIEIKKENELGKSKIERLQGQLDKQQLDIKKLKTSKNKISRSKSHE